MEKILLLNPPALTKIFRDNGCSFSSKADYYWPATDLLVLSGILSPYYKIDVIDAVAEGLSYDKCIMRIRNNSYRAIFFLTGTSSWKKDFEFVRKCKEETNAIVIGLGGILLAKGKEFFRKFSFLDAIILDYTTKTIIDYLKGNYERVKGVLFRFKDEIITTSIDSEPFFYPVPRHLLFPLRKYSIPTAHQKPFSCIITNFGCPFSCSYCIGSLFPYKERKIENIREELLALENFGINEIFFCDMTFTVSASRTDEICDIFTGNSLNIGWSCNIHPQTVDKELLKTMKNAGCHTVLIGVESGDDTILEHYSKGTTIEQICKVFSWCKEIKMKTVGYFIIGFPQDTYETVQKTIDFACFLNPDFASFTIASPEVGTSLWNEAIQERWIDEKYDISNTLIPPVLKTMNLSSGEIEDLFHEAYRRFYFRPKYLWHCITELNSPSRFMEFLKNGVSLIVHKYNNVDIFSN